MNKKTARIAGIVMLIIAITFIIIALNHPEMSFPWNNTITYMIYSMYTIIMIILLIMSINKNK